MQGKIFPLSSASSGGEGRGEEALSTGTQKQTANSKIENDPLVTEADNTSSRDAAGVAPFQIEIQKSKIDN